MLVLGLALAGCGGGGDDETIPTPLNKASGQGSIEGRVFAPTHGASQVLKSGTVNTVLSDQVIGCDAFAMTSPPKTGMFVQVQVAKAELGLSSRHMIMFSDFAHDLFGTGSSSGTVEVTELSDASISLKIAYTDTIENRAFSLDGEFGAIRCP